MGILGFIVMVVMVCAGLIQAGEFSSYIDIPSFMLTVIVTVFALLMSFGSGFGTAIKTVFSKRAGRDALALGVMVFERGQSYAIASGIMATVIGLVIMLKNLDNPDAVGPGMATALITSLYGLMLAYGVFLPVLASLKRRLGENNA